MARPLILLVEDNPDDEFLALRAIHKALDADVEVAHTGPAALSLLERNAREGHLPELLLLDLRLPGMDGLEVLARIRDATHLESIRVIALTSSESPQDREACKALGAQVFLSKPLQAQVLKELLMADRETSR